MASRIMSACCQASVLCLYLLTCFLQAQSQTQVFRQPPQAHNVLLRSRRANTFLLEELLQGNLERECYEERCNFEEAREYFEDMTKTISFWTTYLDEDQCEPNPCLHGGNCTDLVRGFHCSCVAPYRGSRCEQGRAKEEKPSSASQVIIPEMKKCPTEGPAACQQLCTASYHSFTCSCMRGFKLHSDKRSCLPTVEFPCGRLPAKLNTSESMCRQGNCPWQVSLLNRSGELLCSGVVLGSRSILTTAHCLLRDSGSRPRPSDFQVIAGNHNMPATVQALHIHNRFHTDHRDNDLALLELAAALPFGPTLIQLCLPTKDFSENVLMHPRRTGVMEEKEGHQDLVYMTLDECHSQLNVSYQLTNKMFCMMRQNRTQGNQNRALVTPNTPLGTENELHRMGHSGAQSPHGHLASHRGHKRMMDRHPNNMDHTHTGGQGVSDGPQTNNSSSSFDEPSEEGGLLPGAPVATVEHGTAYLTGLMISSPADSGGSSGLVFTKLSRYLSWIKSSLEATEDHMTPQVSEFPDNH